MDMPYLRRQWYAFRRLANRPGFWWGFAAASLVWLGWNLYLDRIEGVVLQSFWVGWASATAMWLKRGRAWRCLHFRTRRVLLSKLRREKRIQAQVRDLRARYHGWN